MKEQTNEEREKSSKKVLITLIVIVFVVTGIIFYLKGIDNTDYGLDIMACIAHNSTLYISTGCSHCAQQEQILGKYIGLFNITDCLKDSQDCVNLNIVQVPTWVIYNKSYSGITSISNLKEYTKC